MRSGILTAIILFIYLNIDILEVDYCSYEFLNNFFETGYIPGY